MINTTHSTADEQAEVAREEARYARRRMPREILQYLRRTGLETMTPPLADALRYAVTDAEVIEVIFRDTTHRVDTVVHFDGSAFQAQWTDCDASEGVFEAGYRVVLLEDELGPRTWRTLSGTHEHAERDDDDHCTLEARATRPPFHYGLLSEDEPSWDSD